MPEHFLALVKQNANLTSNNEAERNVKAILNCLENTIDFRLMSGINAILPEYLQSNSKKFFSHRKQNTTSFNTDIFYERLVSYLGLTDKTEAQSRFRAFVKALNIVQPGIETRMERFLPSDLNLYLNK